MKCLRGILVYIYGVMPLGVISGTDVIGEAPSLSVIVYSTVSALLFAVDVTEALTGWRKKKKKKLRKDWNEKKIFGFLDYM